MTADENGEALFENVDYGTWTAVVTLYDITATQQIEVPQTIEREIKVELTLSSLPLKTTKLKIGGIKWILFARDHAEYPSGAQTLISEFTVDPNTSFGSSVNYQGSNLQTRMGEIYNSFLENEKKYIIETTRKYKNGSGAYPTFNEYVFPLNSTEVAGNNSGQMGSNLGFSSNADRICTNTSGSAQPYWLADANSHSTVCHVYTDGLVYSYDPSRNIGVRPACNLSPDTPVKLGDDGYYVLDVPAPVLISFSIANVPFQAEEGMTWEQWVSSDYNTDTMYAYHINNGLVEGTEQRFTVRVMDNRTATQAKATDVIVNNGVYYHLY